MSKPIGDIELQIMWNRLIAVVEEQAQTLLRTAFSSIVREAGDLSAGIFDRTGRMLAQAVTGTPGHVNSMAESVKHFIAHFGLDSMQPGDAYITNDPWMGTGHLNDFVITTPCFHKGKLVGLFSCTSHLMDIGGIGFGPDGTDVFMEGLYIPFLKVLDAGKVNETLMAMIRANTRLPIDTVGDVYSLMACNDVGCQRLVEMMDEFDLDNLDELAEHICAKSRAAVLAEIAQLPKGSWSNAMTTDGFDGPITLRATTTISDSGIHVDYTGTDPQARRGINVPFAYTTAYTVFGLGCIVAEPHPQQCGLAGAADGVGAGGLHPQRQEAGGRLHPPHHRPDAARRGVRLPRPGHPRPRAGGGHLVPVEHHRARLGEGRRGRQLRLHHGDHLQRRHGRAAARRRALGHRLSVGRQGHAGGDRRGHHAADLLEEGAAARLRRRRAHARRARAGSSRSRAASASRSSCWRRSTASTSRRAAATAAVPARPAWSR